MSDSSSANAAALPVWQRDAMPNQVQPRSLR